MRASAIAETLVNGNISTARQAINRHRDMAALTALDVVEELVDLTVDFGRPTTADDYYECIDRVRRCLNGG